MTTKVTHMAQVITNDRALGDSLGNLARRFPNDPPADTFYDDAICNPLAWWAEIPCTEAFAKVIDALSEDADYSDERLVYLRERGLTAELWQMAKAGVVASQYQRIVDGELHINRQAMTDLSAAHGYTIVEPGE